MRVGILTISTSYVHGARQTDASGDAIAEIMTAPPIAGTITVRGAVADDQAAITAQLCTWADNDQCDVILTTGGTGLSLTDVTPEATMAAIDRLAPGIAEALRSQTARVTPFAWLSRGVAGLRQATLIINLPGSPKAVRECLAVLVPILPHAVAIMTGTVRQHENQGNEITIES